VGHLLEAVEATVNLLVLAGYLVEAAAGQLLEMMVLDVLAVSAASSSNG
jgi:hypothetical protein